jgi:hypothetical protein
MSNSAKNSEIALHIYIYILLPQGKIVGSASCLVFDVRTSMANERLRVILLQLWRINVKTTRGFINIPLEDFQFSHG